jgi:hypothetical protein
MKVIVVAVGASLLDVIAVVRFSLQRCEAGLHTAAIHVHKAPFFVPQYHRFGP